MKNTKVYKYISNITFVIGLVIGVYAIIRMYTIGADLPTGVCLIDSSRPLIIAAIAVLVVSLVFSFLAGVKNKKSADSNKK